MMLSAIRWPRPAQRALPGYKSGGARAQAWLAPREAQLMATHLRHRRASLSSGTARAVTMSVAREHR